MKRFIIIVLTVFGIFCVLATIIFITDEPSNRKITINEISRFFKPTKFLNCQLNIDEVDKVRIVGTTGLNSPDEGYEIYTDKGKIQKLLDYLNSIPFVAAKKEDLPNMSSDVRIHFKDVSGESIWNISVYGQVYIVDHATGEVLMRKDNTWIIDGIENLDFTNYS